MKFAYIFLVVSLVLSFWFARLTWLQNPEIEYVRELFNQSQWRFPISPRVISDEQLYQYAGWYIVQTGDLFTVNPEVPPLAKYVYGMSFHALGNPYFVTPLFLAVVLVTYYYLAKRLEFSPRSRIWLLGLITSAPLIHSQLTQTMLDLPHLMFLLLHVVGLLYLPTVTSRRSQFLIAVLTGLSLGAFAATKVPLHLPIVGLLAVWYCWRHRLTWTILPIFLAAGLLYLGSFIPYFRAGHSLIEWLGTQKWMIHFYSQSQVDAQRLMFPITALTGWYQGWWDQPWQRVLEWSSLWPISFVAPVILIWLMIRRHIALSIEQQYILALILAQMCINMLIPFWPRYYVLLFPFALLCWPVVLSHFTITPKKWLQIAGVSLFLAEAIWFNLPSPTHPLTQASESWEKGNYQDMYQFVSQETRASFSSDEFHRILKRVEYTTSPPEVSLNIPPTWPWQKAVQASVSLTYQTPIGNYTHTAPFSAHRVGSRWAIDWNWQMVLPNFSPDHQLLFIPEYPKVGTLTSQDGIVISQAGLESVVAVIPNQVQAEPSIRILAELTGLQKNELAAQLYVSSVSDWVTPVGKITLLNSELLQELRQQPGIYWLEVPGSQVNPLLSSDSAYAWAVNELTNESKLHGQLGGELLLSHPSQPSQVLLKKAAVQGEDRVSAQPIHPDFNIQ